MQITMMETLEQEYMEIINLLLNTITDLEKVVNGLKNTQSVV